MTMFGMHEPLALAMGVAPASDAFQRRMSNLVIDVKPKPPKCYVDDILAAIDHTHDEHIACIDNIFKILEDAGLQINLKKSSLCQKALECVGFWLMPDGHRPVASRVQGTLDVKPLRNQKETMPFSAGVGGSGGGGTPPD